MCFLFLLLLWVFFCLFGFFWGDLGVLIRKLQFSSLALLCHDWAVCFQMASMYAGTGTHTAQSVQLRPCIKQPKVLGTLTHSEHLGSPSCSTLLWCFNLKIGRVWSSILWKGEISGFRNWYVKLQPPISFLMKLNLSVFLNVSAVPKHFELFYSRCWFW